jgi:hypothetical protein
MQLEELTGDIEEAEKMGQVGRFCKSALNTGRISWHHPIH